MYGRKYMGIVRSTFVIDEEGHIAEVHGKVKVKGHVEFSLVPPPFPLLSDGSHAIAEAYGAWQEKSMYGRKYMGIVRSTFVIDEEGHIAEVHGKVKVKGHVEALLKSL